MGFLEKIGANAVRIVGVFSESATLCTFLLSVISITSIVGVRGIISGLFAMHRSKSALKKICKNYSFGQRVFLKHAWEDCLHAKQFCRQLIVVHHCIFGLLLVQLLLAILSNIWPALRIVIAWFTLMAGVGFLIPVSLLNFSLDRYPFQKRKHEFTFRKYHNTSNHHSLW